MAEMLFYRHVTPLDKDQHRQLKVSPIKEFNFSAKTNSVPLASIEFFEAAREYPIVFAGQQAENLVPAALLGLRDEENLFLTANGRWDARYIPAFVRRYPFVLASADAEKLTVCIDETHPSVGAKNGERLFTEEGEPTPFLNTTIEFMRDFHGESRRTAEFLKVLHSLQLLTEVAANAALKSGGSYQLGGFSVVDERRLRALDKDTVDELFRKGWLALIYAHLLSLGNLGRLVDKLAGRKPTGS